MTALEKPAVVMDCGTAMCKVGFAGDDAPRAVFPPIVGQPDKKDSRVGGGQRDCYVGDEAKRKRSILYPSSQCPIKDGIITNWNDMEKVWHHIFYNELRVRPEEYSVLLSETPLNSYENMEKTVQIMFEKFNSPAVYFAMHPELALIASGRTTGVVLDSGEGQTYVVPIVDSKPVYCAILPVNISGSTLTGQMDKLLRERGYNFTTSAEKEIVREIKEKHSYVAYDFENEVEASKNAENQEVDFTLPDGKIIKLNSERFQCPEILFKPSIAGMHCPGIHEVLFESINKCNFGQDDHTRLLLSSIVLSGGNTCISGLHERLHKEFASLAQTKDKIMITAPPERAWSVWIGGSILASLSSFQQLCLNRNDYEEFGPSVVHRKRHISELL